MAPAPQPRRRKKSGGKDAPARSSKPENRGVKRAHELRERHIADIKKHLPEPEAPDKDFAIPAKEITKLSHRQLQDLHWGALSCYGYANWQVGNLEADLIAYERLEKHAHDKAILEARRKAKEEKLTVPEIEATASLDDDVQTYSEKAAEVRDELKRLLKLRDFYKETLDAASRQFTFREHEAEQSGKAGKKAGKQI